jgi:uncharacterized protein
MKVEIDKSFAMPGSADVAWALLQDIEKVAGCMPGAKITERVDEKNYKGTVAVKFGPANMSFRGAVEVHQVDAATKTLRLVGKGTDTTGSSGAAMDLTARVEAVDAAQCTLVGHSEVSMSGKAATFGGRMAGAVADQVLKQFAGNFASLVQSLQSQVSAPQPAAASSAADAPAAAAPPAPMPTTTAAAAQPVESQLNGLALAWAVFKDWLRSLFSAKRA